VIISVIASIYLELPFREEQDLRAGAVLEATVHTGSGTSCPQDGDLVRSCSRGRHGLEDCERGGLLRPWGGIIPPSRGNYAGKGEATGQNIPFHV
jgi:hypothetical protein